MPDMVGGANMVGGGIDVPVGGLQGPGGAGPGLMGGFGAGGQLGGSLGGLDRKKMCLLHK